ncbi:hypothetical protein K438DRAFT_1927537 [Mycena galopus ATCC 62051]|nr:hypothetical protein K438DRAFT_1927537 [Mycena galopus ATCC 62051]
MRPGACGHAHIRSCIGLQPTIPPSRHGHFRREFTSHARQQGIAHCTATVAEYLNRPDDISTLTDLRAWSRDLLDHEYTLIGRRGWVINISALHELSYVPIPYLYGHEYAKLRLLSHTFRDHGRVAVANIIDKILQFWFCEAEVILQFLYSGMLDAVNPHPEAGQQGTVQFWLGNLAAWDFWFSLASVFFFRGQCYAVPQEKCSP